MKNFPPGAEVIFSTPRYYHRTIQETILCCYADAQSKDASTEKGYYGLVDISGGYIHKWVPGSIQSPYDFMLGTSYVNGYRFSPHFAMGLGVGLNYYFDNEQITAPIYIHLNTDILKRAVTPYVALNLGYNVQLNGGKILNVGRYGFLSRETATAFNLNF